MKTKEKNNKYNKNKNNKYNRQDKISQKLIEIQFFNKFLKIIEGEKNCNYSTN